jgi:hypothetical protein
MIVSKFNKVIFAAIFLYGSQPTYAGQEVDSNRIPASVHSVLDKPINICGNVISSSVISNITIDKYAIKIDKMNIDRKFNGSKIKRGKLCVVGVIHYIGCATGKEICFDWTYDYRLEIISLR